MKLILFYIVSLIILISTYTFAQSGQEYKNNEYSYSIAFPVGWNYFEENNSPRLVHCELSKNDSLQSESDGTISIMVLNLKGNVTNEVEADQYLTIAKLVSKDVKEIKKEARTLSGKEALYHVYTFKPIVEQSPSNYIQVRYYLQKNSYEYIVYFSGKEEIYNQYKNIIDRSLESFKFIEKKGK